MRDTVVKLQNKASIFPTFAKKKKKKKFEGYKASGFRIYIIFPRRRLVRSEMAGWAAGVSNLLRCGTREERNDAQLY